MLPAIPPNASATAVNPSFEKLSRTSGRLPVETPSRKISSPSKILDPQLALLIHLGCFRINQPRKTPTAKKISIFHIFCVPHPVPGYPSGFLPAYRHFSERKNCRKPCYHRLQLFHKVSCISNQKTASIEHLNSSVDNELPGCFMRRRPF